ncbi:arsenosugar biosynthesis-associated peroxidase-like protein [Tautonia sociabilis]|uniref:4-carboxymuconolactone decarboxylase n=1 Tax=Tautonia sociabilis TaxID=2080755 RepID=A0A432MQ20_9BACT|nr:arsenosugar biosynthesis-associated peroxidase-like protein [Tautonia sociabilis]RUL89165.1 4-carboxymuconolactone decarboxylase [Tautonia sociabilis]
MSSYYKPEDLPRFPEVGQGAPALWEKFNQWYGAVFQDGALSSREKALIALAVAHSEQCPYCIDSSTRSCLELGADLAQMTEAIQVAAALRAGITLVHGVQMKDVHDSISM